MKKFHKTLAKNFAGAPQIHRKSGSINTNTSYKNTNTSCTTPIHHQKRPIHNANALNTSKYKHKKHIIPKLRIVPVHLIPSQVVSKHKHKYKYIMRIYMIFHAQTKTHHTQAQNCARAPHSIPGRQQAQRQCSGDLASFHPAPMLRSGQGGGKSQISSEQPSDQAH